MEWPKKKDTGLSKELHYPFVSVKWMVCYLNELRWINNGCFAKEVTTMSMFSHLKRDRDRGRKHFYDVLLARVHIGQALEVTSQEPISSLCVLQSSALPAM